LQIQLKDLSHLDVVFTLQELKAGIFDLNTEKAPCPHGFIGSFYKKCWDIVQLDLLAVVNQIFSSHGRKWRLLNTANIALIPKKEGASAAMDYRPISLMHSFAKIFGKLMASRLALKLSSLISPSQSAFIKKRSIHDNFIFVRGVLQDTHEKKKLLLFLKLDFAKAFYSVNWE
jgi:hypothetical protein